jgi:transcriptional regulator with XRE-family HTH domain
MGKRQPDGKKIVQLREQKGMKQTELFEKARISERLLRDIERTNKPVSPTHITAIATALGTTSDEITLSTPDETSDALASLLKLRAVRSASELNTLASSADRYDWRLNVDPSVATAENMQNLMTILRRVVKGAPVDEFDELSFGQILRLARLQELLDQLHANGVGVLAGICFQHNEDVYSDAEVFLCVHFVTSEVDEEVITLPPSSFRDDNLDREVAELLSREIPD